MKILSKQQSLIIIFIAIATLVGFVFYFFPKKPVKEISGPFTAKIEYVYKEEISLPVRLRIPEINVDSFIEHVGLTADGAMDVPKDINNVAWFNLGTRPGDIGNAVMAGHYGWENKKESVFNNLYKLNIGDKLYVQFQNGEVNSFIVKKIQKYNSTEDASSVFISNDNKEHLNLITCEGVWNDVSKSYSGRLVIFTDKTTLTAL